MSKEVAGLSHDELVKRGIQWLRSQGFPLVFAEMASCSEIPDAIGFATHRTVVVECKTSRSDFLCDKAKYTQHVDANGNRMSCKAPKRYRERFAGCPVEQIPNMGSQRYYLCEPGVITAEMIRDRHPDHGLLHIHGKKVMLILSAPQRSQAARDAEAEVKYLHFALRHLMENLGSAGVRVDLLRASKMFGRESIKITNWRLHMHKRESGVQP